MEIKLLEGAINAAAGVVKTFAESIQGALKAGIETYDLIAARSDERRLKNILATSIVLVTEQHGLVFHDIDFFMKNPGRLGWIGIIDHIITIMEKVDKLLERIEKERSDFILEESYREFIQLLHRRKIYLNQLSRSGFFSLSPLHGPYSLTRYEIDELKDFLRTYQGMIESLKLANAALAEYIKKNSQR
jgi:hypothetical protein